MGRIGRSRQAVVVATDRRGIVNQALFMPFAGKGLIYLFETTDLDRQFAHLFFDEAGGIFSIRQSRFFELVIHKSARSEGRVSGLDQSRTLRA